MLLDLTMIEPINLYNAFDLKIFLLGSKLKDHELQPTLWSHSTTCFALMTPECAMGFASDAKLRVRISVILFFVSRQYNHSTIWRMQWAISVYSHRVYFAESNQRTTCNHLTTSRAIVPTELSSFHINARCISTFLKSSIVPVKIQLSKFTAWKVDVFDIFAAWSKCHIRMQESVGASFEPTLTPSEKLISVEGLLSLTQPSTSDLYCEGSKAITLSHFPRGCWSNGSFIGFLASRPWSFFLPQNYAIKYEF